MGAHDETDETEDVSRRGFLGWGAALLTAVVVPGATLALTENSAAAATAAATMPPYAMASWQALQHRVVRAAAPGRSSVGLQVLKVTDMAVPSKTAMTGDAFAVEFKTSARMPSGVYTVTAPGLGIFPLFIDGTTGTATAMINRRLPVRR